MAMKHVINVLLNQLGFVQGFRMGLLAEQYFYHLIYMAKNSILCNTTNG